MDKQDRNLQKKAPWLIAVIVAVLVLVASAVGWYWLSDDQIVEIGGTTYRAEVVDSPRARAKGLSGRKSLDENRAMLFEFSDSDFHSFWMKDMQFSIDIIWMDEVRRVVHVERGLQPDEPPHRSYRPGKKAKYVLEVAAGQADNVAIGDKMAVKKEGAGWRS